MKKLALIIAMIQAISFAVSKPTPKQQQQINNFEVWNSQRFSKFEFPSYTEAEVVAYMATPVDVASVFDVNADGTVEAK
jgi:hypothetical protein